MSNDRDGTNRDSYIQFSLEQAPVLIFFNPSPLPLGGAYNGRSAYSRKTVDIPMELYRYNIS